MTNQRSKSRTHKEYYECKGGLIRAKINDNRSFSYYKIQNIPS